MPDQNELRASVHFTQRGGNPGDSAVAAIFSDGRWSARRVGIMSNCVAALYSIELALDEATKPVRIANCMTQALDRGPVKIDVMARIRMKLATSAARVEFRHRRDTPQVFDKLRSLARRCLFGEDDVWAAPYSETARAWAIYQGQQALAQQIREEEERQWWADYSAYLNSPEWQGRRKPVLARALGVCEVCRVTRAQHVHHLTYERLFDELSEDLLAVCVPCHESIHDRQLRARPHLNGFGEPC